jgi:hypothetical protein
MTTLNRNLAAILLVAVAASTGGAFAIMQTDQVAPQTQGDSGGVLGHIEMVVKDADGNIKAYRQTDNLIVGNGLNFTSNRLFGTTHVVDKASTANFNYIGVGTTATAATDLDVDLLAVASAHRLATVTNVVTTGGSPDIIGAQLQATWPANRITNSTTVTIVESGVFDNGANTTANANMYSRQVFTGIAMNPADSLTVTWTITFTDSNAT